MRLCFDGIEIDTDTGELRRDGQAAAIEPKVFDLLVYLVRNSERIVSKSELVTEIWDDRYISDAAISSAMNAVRRAIGDDGKEQKFIRTMRGRGFRFVGDVAPTDPRGRETGVGTGLRNETDGLPSIVVMPFQILGNASSHGYLAEGICEDVTTALGRVRWLFVISRSSAVAFQDSPVAVAQAAEQLGVRYVLTGSLQLSADRLRVSVQLHDGSTSQQLWSERYDRDLRDIFDIQDDITESIVGALEPQVSFAEGRKTKLKNVQDFDAWDCVVRAMALKSEFTRDSSDKAIGLLERALEIDPTYARAYAQLGWFVAWRIHQGWEDTDEALARAIAAAESAVKHDANEPWAYIAWLFIATILRDAGMLIDSPRKALEINPNFAMAHSWMGASLALTGRGEEAFEWIERARRLSPMDIFKEEFDVHTSYACFQVGDYRSASEFASKAILPHPHHVYPRLILASSLGHLGAHDAGQAQIHRIKELSPNASLDVMRKSCVFINQDDIERFIEGLKLSGLD